MTADVLREEQKADIEADTAPAAEPDDMTNADTDTEEGAEMPLGDGEDKESEAANGAEGDGDYAALAASDLKELKGEFPELAGLEHISGLDNPLRYAALRDLGLSPREAYLATAKRQRPDGRAHLSSAMPKSAGSPGGGMSVRQLAEAREIFSDMSDVEIRALYKKVTR